MTSGALLVLLVLLAVGALSVATLLVAVRGGRGPGDPPASHARVDPAGFFVLPEPRGVLPRHPARARRSRGPRGRRLPVARVSAVRVGTTDSVPTAPGAHP